MEISFVRRLDVAVRERREMVRERHRWEGGGDRPFEKALARTFDAPGVEEEEEHRYGKDIKITSVFSFLTVLSSASKMDRCRVD